MKRKIVTMLVEVIVPSIYHADEVRDLIRLAIRVGVDHYHGADAIKLRSVKPAATVLADAAMAHKLRGHVQPILRDKGGEVLPLLKAMEGE